MADGYERKPGKKSDGAMLSSAKVSEHGIVVLHYFASEQDDALAKRLKE